MQVINEDKNNEADEKVPESKASSRALSSKEDARERSFSEIFTPEYVTTYHEENFGIYNANLYGIGVVTLWFGWLFFNAGSTLSAQPEYQEQ